MATPVLFVFSLCLLLGSISSKPVASGSGLVQSEDSVFKRTQLDTLTSLKVESVEQVQSLDSVAVPSLLNKVESLRRIKRNTITGNGCSGDMIYFMNRCMTFEMYERILQEADGEK